MNVSWAFTSPPSGMAMVGQPGGGPIKHLSGLGSRCLRPRAFEPRSSTGAVRGGSLPGGVAGVGPLWWGAPPGSRGRRDGSPRPPSGGYRPFLMSLGRSGLRCMIVFPFCWTPFERFSPPPLAAAARFPSRRPLSRLGPGCYRVKLTLRALDGPVEGGGDIEVGACLVELY